MKWPIAAYVGVIESDCKVLIAICIKSMDTSSVYIYKLYRKEVMDQIFSTVSVITCFI